MGKYLNSSTNRFFTCGICGEDVVKGSMACKACGADSRTGLFGEEYGETESAADLGDDFDYDEFMKREFGISQRFKPWGLAWYWWVVGLIMLVVMGFASLR